MDNIIRRLAKSYSWQVLYQRAKEIGSFQLFDNKGDLTRIQAIMLHYLELYNGLYTDLAMGEDFISQDVIDDMLRTDAYILYRNNKRKDERAPKKKNQTGKIIDTNSEIPNVIFTKRS